MIALKSIAAAIAVSILAYLFGFIGAMIGVALWAGVAFLIRLGRDEKKPGSVPPG